MDPFLAAMLMSGGVGLAGQFLGNTAASRANRRNQQIANQNLLMQAMQNARARAVADRYASEQRQGYIDANGNQVRFIPGQGWVTTLAPEQRNLQRAGERNALYDATTGEMRRRVAGDRAAGQSFQDDLLRQMFMRQMRTPIAERGTRQMRAAQGLADIAEGEAARDAGKLMNRVALRSGRGAPLEQRVSQRARDSRRASRANRLQALMNAMSGRAGRNQQRQTNAANLVRAFSRRSPGGAFIPTVGGMQIPSMGAVQQGALLAARGQPLNAPYSPADFGTYNLFQRGSNFLDDWGPEFLDWYDTPDVKPPREERTRGNQGVRDDDT